MLTRLEIRRQIFHIFASGGMAVLYYLNVLSPLAVFLGIVAGILLSFICKRVRFPLFSWFLYHFERSEERKRFPGRGTLFLFIGVLITMKLFPKEVALASIMILAFGDSVSHLFGGKFGKLRNIFNWKSKKMFEGTLMGTTAGFFAAMLFVSPVEALLGSFAAMAAEVVKLDFNETTIDDNLIVPLIAGTTMVLVRKLLSYSYLLF